MVSWIRATFCLQIKFGDSKVLNRSLQSNKKTQYNDHKKRKKRRNTDLQNTTQKTNDSCSASNTHRTTKVAYVHSIEDLRITNKTTRQIQVDCHLNMFSYHTVI
jgi:hypothetical protein